MSDNSNSQEKCYGEPHELSEYPPFWEEVFSNFNLPACDCILDCIENNTEQFYYQRSCCKFLTNFFMVEKISTSIKSTAKKKLDIEVIYYKKEIDLTCKQTFKVNKKNYKNTALELYNFAKSMLDIQSQRFMALAVQLAEEMPKGEFSAIVFNESEKKFIVHYKDKSKMGNLKKRNWYGFPIKTTLVDFKKKYDLENLFLGDF